MQEFYFSIDGYNADPEYIGALVNQNLKPLRENFALILLLQSIMPKFKIQGIFPMNYIDIAYRVGGVSRKTNDKDGVWIPIP